MSKLQLWISELSIRATGVVGYLIKVEQIKKKVDPSERSKLRSKLKNLGAGLNDTNTACNREHTFQFKLIVAEKELKFHGEYFEGGYNSNQNNSQIAEETGDNMQEINSSMFGPNSNILILKTGKMQEQTTK